MIECPSCIQKGRDPRCWVELPNEICCTCAFTPEECQRVMMDLRRDAQWARESLRDRFAMAALTGLLAHPSSSQSLQPIVRLAFECADEAVAQRSVKAERP